MAFQGKKPEALGVKAPFGFIKPALAASIGRVPFGERPFSLTVSSEESASSSVGDGLPNSIRRVRHNPDTKRREGPFGDDEG
ncbi:hypothetical protein [Bradyrhizobium sp. LA2.1]|uniref:hypothetical protein n=1 Tax=Bradyrhizobium sp. LA2.1 TaxID=3156376 RepID=UPI00339A6BAD